MKGMHVTLGPRYSRDSQRRYIRSWLLQKPPSIFFARYFRNLKGYPRRWLGCMPPWAPGSPEVAIEVIFVLRYLKKPPVFHFGQYFRKLREIPGDDGDAYHPGPQVLQGQSTTIYSCSATSKTPELVFALFYTNTWIFIIKDIEFQ